MHDLRNILILTGAGISAESGLATFRGPGGLWEGHRVEDVCTPEALARDPALVHRFYDAPRVALGSVEPNPAHTARYHGARTLELNLDPSAGSIFFHETRIGRASELVPLWVSEAIAA